MDDLMRQEILRRFHGGASRRAIGRALGLDRKTVGAVLRAYEVARATSPSVLRAVASRRSQLDAYAASIQALLARYPDITAVRLMEELRTAGFTGGYSIVKDCARHGIVITHSTAS